MHNVIPALLVYLAQQFGGSTGWAIVALSLGIRLALLPLTLRLSRRALRNQEIARALQPEIEALKKRFEKRPEKLFEEIGKVYRRRGYRPFDLPAFIGAFIQLPIFGMLYRGIGAVLASGERFYWIRSLAAPDFWLTLIVVALSAATGYFLPGASEGARRTMVAVQVGITFLIVWKLAAGYGLYWASSSVVGLGQSLWLRHERARKPA